jgi:hypothetical protein
VSSDLCVAFCACIIKRRYRVGQLDNRRSSAKSDAIEWLFQPVFTTKPNVDGTGLGVSIITQPHDDTIEVDKFTEFIVHLLCRRGAAHPGALRRLSRMPVATPR